MRMIIRVINKFTRLFRAFIIQKINANNIILSDKVKIDIMKYPSLVFETKEAKCYLRGNLYARNNFTMRVCSSGILEIGKNVFFNNMCSITCRNRIIIGNDCIFGENVKIYDHNHTYKEKGLISRQGFSDGEVIIGHNCWIGSNVVILKDVHIGNNSVIGAGCVVYKDDLENQLLLNNGKTINIIRDSNE